MYQIQVKDHVYKLMVGGGRGSKRVIYAALLGNLGIARSKLVNAILTNITSMVGRDLSFISRDS